MRFDDQKRALWDSAALCPDSPAQTSRQEFHTAGSARTNPSIHQSINPLALWFRRRRAAYCAQIPPHRAERSAGGPPPWLLGKTLINTAASARCWQRKDHWKPFLTVSLLHSRLLRHMWIRQGNQVCRCRCNNPKRGCWTQKYRSRHLPHCLAFLHRDPDMRSLNDQFSIFNFQLTLPGSSMWRELRSAQRPWLRLRRSNFSLPLPTPCRPPSSPQHLSRHRPTLHAPHALHAPRSGCHLAAPQIPPPTRTGERSGVSAERRRYWTTPTTRPEQLPEKIIKEIASPPPTLYNRPKRMRASLTRIFHGFRQPDGVAQASSLPYRGFPIRRCRQAGTACRPEVGDTAGWKPALRSLGSPVPFLGREISGLSGSGFASRDRGPCSSKLGVPNEPRPPKATGVNF